jgi:hypothetical protein
MPHRVRRGGIAVNDYADAIAARILDAKQHEMASLDGIREIIAAAAREGYALGYAAGGGK